MMATQNQEMTRILAEALASTQFQAPKITAPYDIHHPPPDGKHPSLVRHNASLNFDGKEVPLHAWVNSIEAFCKLHKTCAPALLASGYLIKGAAAWLHAKYGEQDMDTVTWNDFCSAFLNSYLQDATFNQCLLNQCKELS